MEFLFCGHITPRPASSNLCFCITLSPVCELPLPPFIRICVLAFSKVSSQPRDQICISCISGRFFAWEAQWQLGPTLIPHNLPHLLCLIISAKTLLPSNIEGSWLWCDIFVFSLFIYLFLNFWLYHPACWILVPWPRTKPVPPTVEVKSPDHWPTR